MSKQIESMGQIGKYKEANELRKQFKKLKSEDRKDFSIVAG